MDCWMTSIELSALRSRERPKRIHATFNLIVTSSFLIVINSVNFLFIVLILKIPLQMERGLSADAPMEPCWYRVIDRFIEKKTTNEFQTLLVAIFVICIFNCI